MALAWLLMSWIRDLGMRLLLVAAFGLLATGAAAQAEPSAKAIDVEMAKKCVFVDSGITAARGGSIEEVALGLRQKAIIMTASAGANAFVMKDITASGVYPMMLFDMYRCP